jgi:Ras-related protein Rab-13
MSDLFDLNYRIIILGEGSVGKSSLIRRFVYDNFEFNSPTTYGISDHSKKIDIEDQKVSLTILDTAGQERFRCIVPSYFRGSHAAILVYDITDKKTFEKVPKWIKECKDSGQHNISFVLIGNKSDLESKRQVTIKSGLDLAKNHNMLFFETSCKDSINVEKAFFELTRHLCSSKINIKSLIGPGVIENTTGIVLQRTSTVKKKKGCCSKSKN